jgi:hypothetical protein
MKAIELRDKLNEFIAFGRGDEPVLFDSDAMCFDQHMVDIEDVSWEDPKKLGDDFNGFWLHWDWQTTKCHHNISEEQQTEMIQKYMEKMRPYYEENNKKVVL